MIAIRQANPTRTHQATWIKQRRINTADYVREALIADTPAPSATLSENACPNHS